MTSTQDGFQLDIRPQIGQITGLGRPCSWTARMARARCPAGMLRHCRVIVCIGTDPLTGRGLRFRPGLGFT